MSVRPSNSGRWLAALAVAALMVVAARYQVPSQSLAAEKASASKDAGEKPVPTEPTLSFEKDVAPIIAAKCARCHGQDVQKSELDLSSPQGVLKGGASGVSIVPHKPDESLLYDYISNDQMPPDDVTDPKKRLTKAEIETIHDWIAAGARFADPSASEAAISEEPTSDEAVYVMLLHCTACHGAQKQEAGLDLRSRASMLIGGRSGPAIVPGKPEESLLLKRIDSGEMPPKRRLVEVSVKPVDAQEIELLKHWIELGAPESTRGEDVATTAPDPLVSDEDRQFWSFQPPQPARAPEVRHSNRVRNAIDAFVLARLEAVGLSLADETDLRTLVRRAYFDLTGLPPDPAEVDRVVNDRDPKAYEKLIDRLLDSPAYGERWGRYWLDLAGYADSEGKTYPDYARPFAYRYRDYVIRSLNADKPYDRFLLEQFAGDELLDYENVEEMTPEIYDNLVATGFLRLSPDGTSPPITNYVTDRVGVVADEMQVIGSAVLGLTIHCARCHSHKFDPIPHRDYYRLMAIIKPALDEHDWIPPNNPDHIPAPLDLAKRHFLPCTLSEEVEEVAAHNSPLLPKLNELEAQKEALTRSTVDKLLEQRLDAVSDRDRPLLAEALQIPPSERSEVQRTALDVAAVQLDLDYQLRRDKKYLQKVKKLDEQLLKINNEIKMPPLIRAAWDRGNPSPTYIYRRGEPTAPTRRVGPGVPSVLTDGRTPFRVTPPWPGAKSTGRRLAFAKWLAEPDHPLTARVMVNRIWLHHFGKGLVATPDNFGKMGSRPSHPELLDWLAIEFMRRGWSIKSMHRLMMTSSTYRQSSHVTPEQLDKDADNSLLSRMPLRRLDAEALRDSLITVAGRLDATRFGPPDPIDARADGLVTVRGTDRGWRRSIYTLQYRTELPTLLESFDFPQMSPNCVERACSTVAPQALQLLNDAQVHQLSQTFADRVLAAAGENTGKQIEAAYRLALGRSPTSQEKEDVTASLRQLTNHWVEHQRHGTIAVDTSADIWIRESEPESIYEDDLIYVHSKTGRDKARRFSLIEFDLKQYADRKLVEARLEFSPIQASLRLRQTAALIPSGIEKASWTSFQKEKASSVESLESLGSIDITTRLSDVGKYCVGQSASESDLARLQERVERDGRVTFVLTAVEDGKRYEGEWDDAKGIGTNGKRPRLVVRFQPKPGDEIDPEVIRQARHAALANFCHALMNSAEFVYID